MPVIRSMWIVSAWKEASPDSLRKAWNKLLPESESGDGNSLEMIFLLKIWSILHMMKML